MGVVLELGMRSLVFAASALALALGVVPSVKANSRPVAATAPRDDLALVFAEVQQHLDNNDQPAAYNALERLTRQAAFTEQPPEIRHAVWVQMAECARAMRDAPKAKAAIDQAVLVKGATADDWFNRYDFSRRVGDDAGTVASLIVLARDFPQQSDQVPDRAFIFWLDRASQLPNGEDASLELAQALANRDTQSDPFTDFSEARQIAVEGLLRKGQVAQAVEIARRINNPDVRIAMRADKRYDALSAAAPSLLDPRAAAIAQLTEVDTLREKYPRRLSGVSRRVSALLDLHRFEDALAFVDPLIAQARKDPTAFDDNDTFLGRTINLRVEVLQKMGRHDEAMEDLAAAARLPENGKPNVNQTVNLAGEQMNSGAFKSALATVATIRQDNTSAFGRAVILRIVGCSKAQLGDLAASNDALDQLRAMKADGADQLGFALLCSGDLDGVAALVIARLADPAQRNVALLRLQVTPSRDQLSTLEMLIRDRRQALNARPDIQAAVSAVGRIETYRPEDLWPTKPAAAPLSPKTR